MQYYSSYLTLIVLQSFFYQTYIIGRQCDQVFPVIFRYTFRKQGTGARGQRVVREDTIPTVMMTGKFDDLCSGSERAANLADKLRGLRTGVDDLNLLDGRVMLLNLLSPFSGQFLAHGQVESGFIECLINGLTDCRRPVTNIRDALVIEMVYILISVHVVKPRAMSLIDE